jgi:lipid A ethanolaminephosphotransferase
MGNITSSRVIFYVAIFFTLFFNYSFFKNVIEVYGLDGYSSVYIISIVLVLVFFLILFFTLLSARFIPKQWDAFIN